MVLNNYNFLTRELNVKLPYNEKKLDQSSSFKYAPSMTLHKEVCVVTSIYV